MTKQLTFSLNSRVAELLSGRTTPSRLTPTIAVQLAQLGVLTLDGDKLVLDETKAKRRHSRFIKKAGQVRCNIAVDIELANILKEDGACTQHRQVWVAVGRNEFSREAVLTSLQTLRSEGTLRSFKSSTNNFQVFWARLNDEPTAGDFEVNGK